MESVQITGSPRTELGKKATRALRKAGNIPCNIYGGEGNVNFHAPANAFRKLIFSPLFKVAEIEVDGKNYRAIVKELQSDPVRDDITHIDFQELREDKAVIVELPVQLTGNPVGVAAGGKLEQALRKVKVSCLPKDLVSVITVDVSEMDLNHIKRIRDLSVGNITILNSDSMPVARVMVPRAVKEETPAAAAPAAAAPAAAPAADAKKAPEKK